MPSSSCSGCASCSTSTSRDSGSPLASDPYVTVADYGARVCDGTTAIPDLRPDGAHPTEGAAQEIWRWLGPQVLQAVESAR